MFQGVVCKRGGYVCGSRYGWGWGVGMSRGGVVMSREDRYPQPPDMDLKAPWIWNLGFHGIWLASGRYASYWKPFLFCLNR